MSLSVTTKGSTLEYDPNIPPLQVSELVLNDPITIRPNFHDIHRRSLEKSNPLFNSILPYIQTKEPTSYVIFLAWWGFAWATHSPYKAYPNNQETFFTAQMVKQCNDVSRLFTVKNVNKLFSNNLTQTLHGTGVIYQHVAIKIIYINVGKYSNPMDPMGMEKATTIDSSNSWNHLSGFHESPGVG